MSKTLRFLAVAAMAAGASIGAVASPLTLDFEALGLESKSQSTTQQPVGIDLVGSTDASLGGVGFSVTGGGASAKVFYTPLLSSFLTSAPSGDNGVALVNTDVTLNLGSLQYDQLAFDFAFGSGSLEYSLVFANGSSVTGTTGSAGSWPWSHTTIGTAGENIRSVTFANSLFVLDNLNFTLSTATGGGTAPEPASFALVALALAGAGVASRRRRA